MVSRVAFGPKDSFCFNYSDPLKATSAGLPPLVKALFEKDRASPVTEVSCLALGPDVRYAVVYNSQGQWRFGEHNCYLNVTGADVNHRSGREVTAKIKRLAVKWS
jgi:hypothetical protein